MGNSRGVSVGRGGRMVRSPWLRVLWLWEGVAELDP